jgi:adhesin transport system membrane fusion protein
MSGNKFNKDQSVVTVDDEERRASKQLLRLTGITLVVFLAWAAFFDLEEITRGQGRVIPASREQVVQSLDSGILREMKVHEGQMVEAGEVLLLLDDSRAGPVFREATEKTLALSAQVARLRAEAYATPLVFPKEVRSDALLVQREQQAYDARKRALDEQIAALKNSLKALQASQTATQRELDMTTPLVKQGVISEVEALRLQRQLSDLNRQQADLQGQMVERRNRYLTDANAELVRLDSELSQTRENALARKDSLKRTVVRSPMKGVVKNIQVTTLGGVVQTGQSIMEIVPTQDELLVEAYVKPAEVAFLKVGQQTSVKLTAYDFNKYGALDGVLEHLSPDTLKDDRNRRQGSLPELEEGYYRILVRIKKDAHERSGMVLTPIPGMTAIVEIRTGHKSVLEYLFRPLQSVSQALRER